MKKSFNKQPFNKHKQFKTPFNKNLNHKSNIMYNNKAKNTKFKFEIKAPIENKIRVVNRSFKLKLKRSLRVKLFRKKYKKYKYLILKQYPKKISATKVVSRYQRLKRYRSSLGIQYFRKKLRLRKLAFGNLSFKKLAFSLSKHAIFYPKTLTENANSGEFSFQVLSPFVTLLELKQFITLLGNLSRYDRHMLYVFIDNPDTRVAFESIINFFPYVRDIVSIQKSSTIQLIDTEFQHCGKSLVLFLGNAPRSALKFLIAKNFIVISAVNLLNNLRLQHYKVTGDIRNIKGVTWILAFLNNVYRQSQQEVFRFQSFATFYPKNKIKNKKKNKKISKLKLKINHRLLRRFKRKLILQHNLIKKIRPNEKAVELPQSAPIIEHYYRNLIKKRLSRIFSLNDLKIKPKISKIVRLSAQLRYKRFIRLRKNLMLRLSSKKLKLSEFYSKIYFRTRIKKYLYFLKKKISKTQKKCFYRRNITNERLFLFFNRLKNKLKKKYANKKKFNKNKKYNKNKVYQVGNFNNKNKVNVNNARRENSNVGGKSQYNSSDNYKSNKKNVKYNNNINFKNNIVISDQKPILPIPFKITYTKFDNKNGNDLQPNLQFNNQKYFNKNKGKPEKLKKIEKKGFTNKFSKNSQVEKLLDKNSMLVNKNQSKESQKSILKKSDSYPLQKPISKFSGKREKILPLYNNEERVPKQSVKKKNLNFEVKKDLKKNEKK